MAESLNPTFFAFRKRENGGVLLGATIAYLIGNFLVFMVFAALLWTLLGGADFLTFYRDVVSAQAQGQTPTATPPNMSGILLLFPLQIVLMFAIFLLLAAYESAAVRWMVRGERSGPLQLHFGADMWRTYGTYWAWLLYCIIGFIGFFLVMALGGFLAATLGDAGPWLLFLVSVGYMLAWLYTTVRLSPASATSIGIGQFSPLKAWTVSRGRFWSLFGAYVLLFIIYIVSYIVIASVFMGAFYAQIFSGLDWTTLQSDPAGFESAYSQATLRAVENTFSNPASIALYVGGQLALWAFVMVFYLLYFGVESRAVQAALEEGKIERAPAEG
jgi:hypothetical protein